MPKDLKQHYVMLAIAESAWEDEYQEWLREEKEKKAAEISENAEKEAERKPAPPGKPSAHTKHR
jgi:hypothetical protein